MFFNKETKEKNKQKRKKLIEIDNLKQIIKTNEEDLQIKRLKKQIEQQNKPFKTLKQEIKSNYNKTSYLNRLKKKENLKKDISEDNKPNSLQTQQPNSFGNVLLPDKQGISG